MDPYHDKQSLSLSFSLCLINKLRHVCSWQSVRERERQSCREGEIKIPISPVTHIIRYTLCLLTDWHRARLDAAAASWKMLRVNLWQPKCDHVFEAGTFASALLIPPFFSLFFFFWGTSFPIQGNGVGVMNSCRGQTMSPLWPPVCKWNSQQSTGQEVILVYSLGTRLCREHSGRFSSPSFLNGTMQPLFFLQPFFFFFTIWLNSFPFFLAMKLRQSTKDVNTHYLLSFSRRVQTKEKQGKSSRVELRNWPPPCVSVMLLDKSSCSGDTVSLQWN